MVETALKKAERLAIDLASVDYDLKYILDIQKPMHDKYKKLARKV